MKTKSFSFFLCLSLFAAVVQAGDKNHAVPQNKSISFTENKGQFADQNYNPRPDVLFGGTDGQMTFHITRSGISYQLYRVDDYKESEDPKTKEKRKEIIQQTIYRTDIKWVNSNVNPQVVTDEAFQGHNNYYLQQCPNGALEVKSYKGITLQNIYNNIDLHYYDKDGQLKCDYIVAPHADYRQIRLKVEGATLKLQEDGSLIIETPLGSIQEQAPVVFQNGKRLEAHYKVSNNHIQFEIEGYDARYELVIDPVTRLWGTYYGGAGDDLCTSTRTDASGNVYVAGHSGTSTGTTIATTGSHQNVYGGGGFDALLVKFNSAGVRSWGTYYGGAGSDFAIGFAIDASGNLYMSGYTSSSFGTAMATGGSHQSAYGGGTYDGYLVQFNSSGARLWATYYGGAGTDVGNSVSIDPSGDVYLAGYTAGSAGTVIASAGSHQNTYGGGTWDAYLAKFTNGGTRIWATYYGGSFNDAAYECAADASGNVYLSGHTASAGGTVIATNGSHQSAHSGGDDGYLVKFNGSGVRQWGTYYGGVAGDNVYGCATDPSGNVFIAGHTGSNSGTVIATPGSHQSTFGGVWDIFVAKFTSSGVRSWGTYYGDTGTDLCWSCSTDGAGAVYLVGYAGNSTGAVIATPGSHQTTYGGGTYDAYLVKFHGNGVRAWGTYYGGTGDDSGSSSAVDDAGNVYLVGGCTASSTGTAIATQGSHQDTHAGSNDMFLVKFADCNLHTAAINGPVCAGSTLSLTVNNYGSVNPGYSWAGPAVFTSAVQHPTIGNVSPANLGLYTLTLTYGTCVETTTVQVSAVNPQPTVSVNSGTICSGNPFVITPNGANTYTVAGGSFTVSPGSTTSYSVVGTSSAGCVSAPAISNVTVSNCSGLTENNGINAQAVTIFPNPSSGLLNITSSEGVHLMVFDAQGRLLSRSFMASGTQQYSIEHLAPGVYFAKVSYSDQTQVFRVVKQ